ncbi:MAG: metal-dependent transcriptional regulator [Candidatus Hadarchaeales archaeon]
MKYEKSENVEEYLEAVWVSEERGILPAKIKWIANRLGLSPPSAVEMLKKMQKMNLVRYETRAGVSLTKKGREIAKQIIRNHRLAEILLVKILNVKIDEDAVCGIEHHISAKIADAVCTSLNHPRKCPHGNPIPKGRCCTRSA